MTDAYTIGWIVIALAALAAAINQVMQITDRIKGKPAAEELKLSQDNINKRVDQLERDVASLSSKIELSTERIVKEGDERRRALYLEIGKVRTEMKTDTGGIYERIEAVRKELSDNQSGLPSQIIALLRNTGAIKS